MRWLWLISVASLLWATGCKCGDSSTPEQKGATPAPEQRADQGEVAAGHQPQAPKAVLASHSGEVEVRRGGTWKAASPGEQLSLDDAVRTRGAGAATLQVGEATVELGAGTEVSVRELSVQLARLELEHGRLAAELPEEELVLRVHAAQSSAVAEAKSGAFTVFNDGRGLVAVAPTAGEVKLSSKGGDVVLAAGERGQVVDDAKPEKDALPGKVLLKVVWPDRKLPRPREVVVAGTVDSSTTVEINGTPVAVARDGRFETKVPMRRGPNPLSVTAKDLAGKTATEQRTIEVNRGPPSAKADTDDLWK
jgi:hypothetical protein